MIERVGFVNVTSDEWFSKLVPVGLCSIISYVKPKVGEVKLFEDTFFNTEEIVKKIKKFDPEVLGIGCIAGIQYLSSYYIAKKIKEFNPNCLIVMGGPHVSPIAEDILKDCKYVDIIVRKEGETPFSNILDSMDDDKKIKEIPNLVLRDNDKIITTKNEDCALDLNDLPTIYFPEENMEFHTPNFDEMGFVPGDRGTHLMLGIEGSRGCPFNCHFCQVPLLFGRQIRYKSPGRVIDEMEYFLGKYKNPVFNFADTNFSLDKKWLEGLYQGIKDRKIVPSWKTEMRIDRVSEKDVKRMADAGCESVFFGAESGSPRMLEIINKNIDLDKAKRNIEYFDKYGISVFNNFIAGLPGESIEDMKKTRDYALELSKIANVDKHFYFYEIYQQYPGTHFRENWEFYEKKYGCKRLENEWWKDLPPYSEAYVHILPSKNITKEQVLLEQGKFYSSIYGEELFREMDEERSNTLKRYVDWFDKFHTMLH